jgi:hypothetical protein
MTIPPADGFVYSVGVTATLTSDLANKQETATRHRRDFIEYCVLTAGELL